MRFLVRLLGFLFVAGGFVSLVVDGTRAIANGAWAPVPFGETAFRAFPKYFPIIEPAVARHVHPLLWDPVLLTLFTTPTFIVAGLAGFLLMFLARRRREEIGFSSKA